MRCIAVIPARGGSKGIPRKNLAVVGGLPLVQWSIMHAHMSGIASKVIVTTDSYEISQMAREMGAITVDRPDTIAGDNATTEAAVIHALDEIGCDDCEFVLTLQPTSPLRSAGALQNAWAKIQRGLFDSLFSARRVDGYCWHKREGESPQPVEPGPRQMRQKRNGSVLEENGSFYFTRISTLRETGNRLGGIMAYYLMNPLDSFQVDEPSDLATMESLMQVRLPQIAMQHMWRQSQERKTSWLGI